MTTHEFLTNFQTSSPNERAFLINSICETEKFVSNLFEIILHEPSSIKIQVLVSCLGLHANSRLRSELNEYFALPLWTCLSEVRLHFELESSKNENLTAAIDKIKLLMQDSPLLRSKATFFKSLSESVFLKPELSVDYNLLLTVILLQPSSRRFVKPYLEDCLITSRLSSPTELEYLLKYPINELTGVYFESSEEHFQACFKTLQEAHSAIISSGNFESLAKLSTIQLADASLVQSQLQAFSEEQLRQLLQLLRCAGFPSNTASSVLINAILLIFKLPQLNKACRKVDPFSAYPVFPLTHESLSLNDLLDRHFRFLQLKTSSFMQNHVRENLMYCKPVMNRLGKTELGGWSRNACEVVSSAVTRRSKPDLLNGGRFKIIEMELSLSMLPFDEFTKTSWLSLNAGDSIFIGKVEAAEEGFRINYIKNAWFKSCKCSDNLFTCTLQLDSLEANEALFLNSLNFVIKCSDAASSEMSLLRSYNFALQNSQLRLPSSIGDILLGISEFQSIESQALAKKEYSLPDSMTLTQKSALQKVLKSALSITYGPFASGATSVLVEAAARLTCNGERTIIIAKHEAALNEIHDRLLKNGVNDGHISRLGLEFSISKLGKRYLELIKSKLATMNSLICAPLNIAECDSCRDCLYIWKTVVEPQWKAFKVLLESKESVDELGQLYPFASCKGFEFLTFEEHFSQIRSLFQSIQELSSLELLHGQEAIASFTLTNLSRIILMTSVFAANNHDLLYNMNIKFDNLLVDDAHLVPEAESILHLSMLKDSGFFKRLALFGHGVPVPELSLMQRLLSAGFLDFTVLELLESISTPFTTLGKKSFDSRKLQFVNVEPLLGPGEEEPMSGYFQNLDEAEYAVALYQILRLTGVPSNDMAIISASNGQVDLISEVISKRCSWTPFFEEPKFVGTIEQSSGLIIKYAIVSLVRAKSHSVDCHLLDLAISRASESAIILGSKTVLSHAGYSENVSNQLVLQDGTTFASVEQVCKHAYDLSSSL